MPYVYEINFLNKGETQRSKKILTLDVAVTKKPLRLYVFLETQRELDILAFLSLFLTEMKLPF